MKDQDHIPVMLKEMLHNLNPGSGEHILDCTFGAGGYSRAILQHSDCFVYAIDTDPAVAEYAKSLKAYYPERFNFLNCNFAEIDKIIPNQRFDGIVADLGVSSMQLDRADRGFSFMRCGPLDMRMSQSGNTAADFINSAKAEEIADIIYRYGEERDSRKIAANIVKHRAVSPITSSNELASIVRESKKFKGGRIDPATKTFQAIRIHINQELENIKKLMNYILKSLTLGGRLVVLSFHGLEDSIIKSFIKEYGEKKIAVSKYAKARARSDKEIFKILTKKPTVPSSLEIERNPRSASAKLRAAVRIAYAE